MPVIRHFVNGAAATLVASLYLSEPAYATGEIFCEATDGSNASIDVEIGHVPVLAVLGATATDGVETWSTHDIENARPIVLGQGFMDDRQVLVDFTDPNVEGIVVSLRLFHMSSEKSYAEAGVLWFDGVSVFPVQCING
jgi:hypothetical protein